MKSAARKASSWTPRESFVWVSTLSPAWRGRGRPLSLGRTSCRTSWPEGLGAQTTSSPHPPDRDECSGGPSPCSHSCHNGPGRFSCSCPAGFALAGDDRSCRGEWSPRGRGPPWTRPACAQGVLGQGPWPGDIHAEAGLVLRALDASLGVPRPCVPWDLSVVRAADGKGSSTTGCWGSPKTYTWPPCAPGTFTR